MAPTSDNVKFVVSEYVDLPGETIASLRERVWPLPNAHKAKALDDLRTLAQHGLWHEYAHLGIPHWRCSSGGRLVLTDWGALVRPRKPDFENWLLSVEDMFHSIALVRRTAEGAARLEAVFARSLRGDSSAATQMPDALFAGGVTPEAELWQAALAGHTKTQVQNGRWAGTTAHLGTLPPLDAHVGDLWLDPVEAAVAVYIGPGWLSLRPLQGWQLQSWPTPLPLDAIGHPARDLGQPVNQMTPEQARELASAFGKRLPTTAHWSHVLAALDHRRNVEEDLWSMYPPVDWLDWDDGTQERLVRTADGTRQPSERRATRAGARTFLVVGADGRISLDGGRQRFSIRSTA